MGRKFFKDKRINKQKLISRLQKKEINSFIDDENTREGLSKIFIKEIVGGKVEKEDKETLNRLCDYIDDLENEVEKKDKLYNKALKDLVKAEKVIDLMAQKTTNEKINRKERWCKCIKENVECKDEWICKECLKEYFYKIGEEEIK